MTEFILLYVTFLIMLIGLAGVFLPILPGIELVWLAALIYGIVDGILHGLTWTGGLAFAGITVLLIVGLSSDIWITGLGLKSSGTSPASALLAAALMIAGSLLLTPLAGILIGLGCLFLLEFRRHRDWKKAAVSAGSAVAGCLISYGFKFFTGLVMIGIWVLWVVLAR